MTGLHVDIHHRIRVFASVGWLAPKTIALT